MASQGFAEFVRQDLAANRGYPKSAVVLMAFRAAQWVRGRRGPAGRLGYLVVGTAYKLFSEWLLGIELPASTEVGPGLRLRHGVGLVVNPASTLGANVMLRHGVTLGNRRSETDCPRIEDDVEIGAGAIIIGTLTVGRGARIGAGAVVTGDVPAQATVLSPPAVVRERE